MKVDIMIRNSLKLGVGFIIAIALLGVLMYIIGLTGSTSYSSSGDNGPPLTLTGDNVREYDQSGEPPLINPTRYIRQGERRDGGCAFTSYYEPPPGQRYTMGRMLAVNWDTCEWLEEVGALSESDGQEAFEGEDEATDVTEETPTDRSTDRSSAFPQNSTVYVAKLKTGWKDPINLKVN